MTSCRLWGRATLTFYIKAILSKKLRALASQLILLCWPTSYVGIGGLKMKVRFCCKSFFLVETHYKIACANKTLGPQNKIQPEAFVFRWSFRERSTSGSGDWSQSQSALASNLPLTSPSPLPSVSPSVPSPTSIWQKCYKTFFFSPSLIERL